MKNLFLAGGLAFLLVATNSCSKDATNKFNASVTATVGSVAFASSSSNVNVGESAPVSGGTTGGTEQVTITATSDASSSSYIVIAFGYAANDVKTYSISDGEAICAYRASGGGSDDIAVSGTVTITENNSSEVSQGKHLSGTFDFTTSGGDHITGDFSVQVSY